MAVEELQDYLDNGNIHHSVNFPDTDMGVCQAGGRIGILHRNVPNMLGQVTKALGDVGINIDGLQNKSKGAYAYTLMDIDQHLTEEGLESLAKIEGILRVRRIS